MSAVTDLEKRQAALQDEAGAVLAELDLPALGFGPALPTGSYVSGLMVWRDLDVMVLGGPSFAPRDVVSLLGRAVEMPGVTGFDYADERGARSPTGERRDERYHVALRLDEWRVDLSIWLHDDHANVTAYHRELAATLTDAQRLTILRIKDAWYRRPEYPDEVGGIDVYTAVLNHGVCTPEEFGAYLAGR